MQDNGSILILDDEQDFRQLTKKILQKRYTDENLHEYDPIASGAPADDFDWGQYEVLLLDHHLNIDNVTGLDILHQNRDNPDFPATIMLTASDDEEIAFKALKLGISDFIRKQQLTKKILFASIDEAISTRNKKQHQQENLAKIQKIFNKKYFYKALKTDIENIKDVGKRIIIGFRISEKQDSKEPINAFIKDRIIRHIAKESCRYFMMNAYEPYITLFSDTMVAILFDVKSLDFNEQELITNLHQFHLEQSYENKDVDVSYDFVSCVLSLSEKTVTQAELIKYFDVACDKAAKNTDINNQIFITTIQQLQQTEPQPKSFDPQDTQEIVTKTDFNKELDKVKSDPNQVKNDVFEVELNLNDLDQDSKTMMTAINKNRMIKTFQPIIMLSNSEESFLAQHDIYYLSSQLVDENEKEVNAAELLKNIDNNDVIKFYDRWLLKETISNIMDIKTGVEPCYFVLKLQHDSLVDATFFNWLRKLLADYENQNPGKYIVLEISQNDIISNEKQILALINYLNHSHHFRFALSEIDDMNQLVYLTPKMDICMLVLNHEKLSELSLMATVDERPENYLTYLKRTKKYIVATDIFDSTSLTTAIVAGADFAMGDFVGQPKASFEDGDAIPSYEIESDEFVSSRL